MRQRHAELTDDTFWRVPRRTGAPLVQLGSLGLPREQIVECRVEDVVERDTAGKFASLGLLFAATLVLLIGVVEFGWRTHVLLAAVVLSVIGIVIGLEALGINRKVFYRFDVLLRDGRRVGYTTASRTEAEALAAEFGGLGSIHDQGRDEAGLWAVLEPKGFR